MAKNNNESIKNVKYDDVARQYMQNKINSFGFTSEMLKNLQKAAGIQKQASKMTGEDLIKLHKQAELLEAQLYKKKSLQEKIAHQKRLSNIQQAKIDELEALEAVAKANGESLTKEQQAQLTALRVRMKERQAAEQAYLEQAKNSTRVVDRAAYAAILAQSTKKRQEDLKTAKEANILLHRSEKESAKIRQQEIKEELKNKKQELKEAINNKKEELKNDKDAAKKLAEFEKEKAQELADFEDLKQQELAEAKKQEREESKAEMKELLKQQSEDIKDPSSDTAKAYAKLGNQVGSEITNYMNQFGKTTSTILTNLQGTDKNLYNILPQIQAAAAVSPFTTQMEVLQNLTDLTDLGIVYNVEQRAFLESIKDKISTTFDVANGTLLRLIRIQQQDSTKQRMALETSLTEFLNNMFEDSSYMRDNFDTISGTIIDAVSQLGRDQGLEFEYTVQKWLGALQSIGLSSETINMLARAINMLGTGDVTGFANDSGIQTLIAMSTGGNYADILTQGLNSNTANTVISNIISYLQSVSTNDNQVIRSQYANMFGLSMSDMNAIMNLDTETLTAVSDNSLTFNEATTKFNQLYGSMISRTHVAEMVSNIKDNVMQTAAIGLSGNPVTATLWQLLDTADGLIDTDIPAIQAFGSGINLENSIVGLAKLGMAGIGLFLGGINTVAGAIANGGVGINAFDESASTKRGSGFTPLAGLITDESAAITYKQSGNTEDFESQTLAEGAQDAEEKSGIVDDQIEKEKLIIKENYDFSDLGYLQKLVDGDSLKNDPLPVQLINFGATAQGELKNRVLDAIKDGAVDDLNRSLATGSGWTKQDEDFTLLDVMVMLYRVLKAGESDTCVRVDQVLKNNGKDVFMNLGTSYDNYKYSNI